LLVRIYHNNFQNTLTIIGDKNIRKVYIFSEPSGASRD